MSQRVDGKLFSGMCCVHKRARGGGARTCYLMYPLQTPLPPHQNLGQGVFVWAVVGAVAEVRHPPVLFHHPPQMTSNRPVNPYWSLNN
jgi:hypothetical protein